MTRFIYPADFTAQADGRVLVGFPGVTGAHTEGDDIVDAERQAADCLAEAIAAAMVAGEAIPQPARRARGQRLVALDPVIAAKAALYTALRDAGISKNALANKIGRQEKEVRRMLDPRIASKIALIDDALRALGQRLVIEARDDAA